MSETDDTDVLLLIPPDFFLIHTDSEESCYETSHEHCNPQCGIVENLVHQVSKLENRINRIEIGSDLTSMDSNSTIIPTSEMSTNQYRNTDFRYFNNDVPSTRSTPQKPRTKLSLSSLPSTPSELRNPPYKPRRFSSKFNSHTLLKPNQSTDADESGFSTTPEKQHNKKILGEIDQFLSNVKTIQLYSQNQSNPVADSQQDESITLHDLRSGIEETSKRINRLNLKDVDKLLQSLESQQKAMDSSVRLSKISDWKCGDNQETVPDLGYGMRETMYRNKDFESVPKTTWKCSENDNTIPDLKTRDIQPPESIINKAHITHSESKSSLKTAKSDSSSSDSIPRTVLERHPKEQGSRLKSYSSVEKFAKQLYKSNETVNDGISPFKRKNAMGSVNLFSLADIWNTNGGSSGDLIISDKEMKKLLPKLEEEKCRRKHCEKLIQELQMKILEMQQRLAVAVQVDSAKDEAILKFHEAWEKVAQRWQSLESERNALSNKVYALEEKSNTDVSDALQKVSQCELELSKALNIAQTNQIKCANLEEERTNLLEQLNSLRVELKSSRNDLNSIATERDELSKQISDFETESLKDKKILLETQNEVAQSRNVFLNCQNELKTLREEYIKLQEKIKGEQAVVLQLETQKKNLQQSLDNVRKNEISLQQEVKKLKEDNGKEKLKLRNFYQQQVEILVNDKLKEFQDQLENAEKSLQSELQTKEQAIIKSAAKQLQKLTEKHGLEIQLVEEKHKEEIRLFELQYNQQKQENIILQKRLDTLNQKRANIAKELHNVMEAQWLEALKIINNGRSPMEEPRVPEKTEFSITDLKRLISANNRELQNMEVVKESKMQENIKKSDTGIFETPVSSRNEAQTTQTDNQLHKYMQMILEKVNRNTENIQDQNKQPNTSLTSSNSEYTDAIPWHQLISAKEPDRSSKENRSGKPPWK